MDKTQKWLLKKQKWVQTSFSRVNVIFIFGLNPELGACITCTINNLAICYPVCQARGFNSWHRSAEGTHCLSSKPMGPTVTSLLCQTPSQNAALGELEHLCKKYQLLLLRSPHLLQSVGDTVGRSSWVQVRTESTISAMHRCVSRVRDQPDAGEVPLKYEINQVRGDCREKNFEPGCIRFSVKGTDHSPCSSPQDS